MDHKFIRHVNIGDQFEGLYFLEAVAERTAKNNNKYTDLTIRDRSGSAVVRFWGEVDGVKKNEFVYIKAKVEEFGGKPQVVAETVGAFEGKPDDMTNYISVSSSLARDIEQFGKIQAKVKELGAEIKTTACDDILTAVFTPEETVLFNAAPYGTLPHYGRSGGLLAHTVKTTVMAFDMAKHYGLNNMEKTIVLTSGLLHAVGGVEAYANENLSPKETTTGVLLGRVFLTLSKIETALQRISKADPLREKIALRIRHAVSCCGYSTVRPSTKESLVLFEAYRSDYSIVEALDFIAADTSGEAFTAFNSDLKRRFFKG